MLETILAFMPWEVLIVMVIEYALGKTDWIQSNSLLELALNLILKILSRKTAI